MNTVLSTAHSTAFHLRQSISATFSSLNSQHTIQTQHWLTVSAYKTDYTAMLSSNYIASTHNIAHSPCTSTCTTHPAIPSPLPSTTLLCTQQTQNIVGKMAQDVGMVSMCRGVVPILFGWFLTYRPQLVCRKFVYSSYQGALDCCLHVCKHTECLIWLMKAVD